MSRGPCAKVRRYHHYRFDGNAVPMTILPHNMKGSLHHLQHRCLTLKDFCPRLCINALHGLPDHSCLQNGTVKLRPKSLIPMATLTATCFPAVEVLHHLIIVEYEPYIMASAVPCSVLAYLLSPSKVLKSDTK